MGCLLRQNVKSAVTCKYRRELLCHKTVYFGISKLISYFQYCCHVPCTVLSTAQQTFVLMKTSWRRLEDVFRLRLQKTSSRRLDQDEYVCLSLTSSEDVFKKSSRRLNQDQYIRLGHTSSRCLAKTSSRSFQDVFKTSCKNVFQTSSRRLANISSTRFQDVSSS